MCYQLFVILITSRLTTFVKGQGQLSGAGLKAHKMSPSNRMSEGKTQRTHPLSVRTASSLRPGLVIVDYDKTEDVQFNYTLQCEQPETVYTVMVTSTHSEVAKVVAQHAFNLSCENATYNTPISNSTNYTGSTDNGFGTAFDLNSTSSSGGKATGIFMVKFVGRKIGRSFLLMFANKVGVAPTMKAAGTNSSAFSGSERHESVNVKVRPSEAGTPGMPPNSVFKGMVLVVRLPTKLDDIFRHLVRVMIILAMAGTGVEVQFDVIKTVLKKPLAPAIALFSQYVCMPLVSPNF